MRQILNKGQVVVCWVLALWSSFLLVAWSVDTDNFMGLMFPAIIIAGLALLTLGLRKRKPQKGAKPAGRDKLASRIITFSLLIIAVALTVIAIKMTVGAPPTKKSFPAFLEDKVEYIMNNPADFLHIRLYYGPDVELEKELPESVDTEGKLIICVRDSRDVFSGKSGKVLLDQFERELDSIRYSSFAVWLQGLKGADILAKFLSEERTPLGYFYQGEYHLWGE